MLKKSDLIKQLRRMECAEIDGAWRDTQTFISHDNAGFLVLHSTIASLSLVLLVLGEYTVRPLSALLGGIGGAAGFFVASYYLSIDCIVRVVSSLMAGISCSLVALFVYKKGLFIVGTAGFSTIAHFAYSATAHPLGVSYYAVVGISGVVGGVVTHMQRKPLLRIASCLLGAGGVAYVSFASIERSEGIRVGSLVLLAIFCGSAFLGILCQYAIDHRRRNRVNVRREQHTSRA